MVYFDTLRRNGWLADPGERVRVVAIHAKGCAVNAGWLCTCDPRLVLAVDPLPRRAKDRRHFLPRMDAASGE